MSGCLEAGAWLDAVTAAASEFTATTLDFPLGATVGLRALPLELTGCYVALVGKNHSVQVGLASDPLGCQDLARALFGTDEDLPDSEVNDALGEIANIIAGGVKSRCSEAHAGLSLGLPMAMEGHVRPSDRQTFAHCDVGFGEVPVRLSVLCTGELAAESPASTRGDKFRERLQTKP